jgi:hypothetical protein
VFEASPLIGADTVVDEDPLTVAGVAFSEFAPPQFVKLDEVE